MTDAEIYRQIKIMLLDGGLSEAGAAEKMGMTKQNLNRKIRSGTVRLSEFLQIANMSGYKVYAERTNDAGEAERTELK